ncbi:hypothetical protein [Mycobacterium spongiae]|nr:hypothetical protein [Mycobacterium spongiae]
MAIASRSSGIGVARRFRKRGTDVAQLNCLVAAVPTYGPTEHDE